MGKRYIYSISSHKSYVAHVHVEVIIAAGHLHGTDDAMECISDFPSKTANDEFLKRVVEMGGVCGTDAYTVFGEAPITLKWFSFTEDVKKKYFEEKFELLKDFVGKMTLEDYALNQDGKFDVMMNKIRTTSEDKVFLPPRCCIMTLDDFMRLSTPGVRYFMGNTFELG